MTLRASIYCYFLLTLFIICLIYTQTNFVHSQTVINQMMSPRIIDEHKDTTLLSNPPLYTLALETEKLTILNEKSSQDYQTNFNSFQIWNPESKSRNFEGSTTDQLVQTDDKDSDPFLIDLEKDNTKNDFEISGVDKKTGHYRGFFLGARIGLPYVLGAEFGYDFGRWARLRTMLDLFGFTIPQTSLPLLGIKFDSKFEWILFGIYADLYPSKHSGFRLTTGFGYNGIKLAAGNETKVFSTKGELFKLEYASKVFFAFGLGFDSNKNLKDHNGFYYSFDFLIYYLGNMRINILDSKAISDTTSSAFKEYLNKAPVFATLGFSLGYRF